MAGFVNPKKWTANCGTTRIGVQVRAHLASFGISPLSIAKGSGSAPKQDASPSAVVERSIVAAREGSYTALGQLLDHYRDYLLRIANDELQSDLVPKVAPSDLVQETFLRAAKRFRSFQGQSEAELRKWLRRILINRLRDANRFYHQSQRRSVAREVPLDAQRDPLHPVQDPQSPYSPPGDELVAYESQAILEAALGRLPEDYRRVIELRHFQHQSLEQVGQQLDRSADAARKLWCRAVERLTRELAEYRPG